MAEISIVTPSYKRFGFLSDCVQSVINQTFQDWELIVVDDNGKGSFDQLKTEQIMERFQSDKRIHYIVQPENRGGSAARNEGWKFSTGKYICFLDNDDRFNPEKLEKQWEALENSSYRATVCRFQSYKKGKLVRTSPIIPIRENYLIPFAKGEINFASGSTLMLERTLLEELEGFDVEFRRKQDVEFMIRLLAKEDLLVSNEVLVQLQIDDRTNIPNLEHFRIFQKMFKCKFEKIFSTLSVEDQKDIFQYELIELAKVSLWNKNILQFLKILVGPELRFKRKLLLLRDLGQKFVTYQIK